MGQLKSGRALGFLAIACTLAVGCSDPPTSPTDPSEPSPPPSGGGRFVAAQLLALPDFASAMVFTGVGRILYTEKGGFGKPIFLALSAHMFIQIIVAEFLGQRGCRRHPNGGGEVTEEIVKVLQPESCEHGLNILLGGRDIMPRPFP